MTTYHIREESPSLLSSAPNFLFHLKALSQNPDPQKTSQVLEAGFKILPLSEDKKTIKTTDSEEHFSSNEFFSAICHELKTPLSAILSFIDLLKEDIDNPNNKAICKEYIKEIDAITADALDLVHDILDVEQAASGDFSVDMSKEIEIKDAVKKAVRLNYDYGLKRNISIKVEISENVKPIKLDNKRMKQVLTNLISNALKYSRAGTEVKILVRNCDDVLEISVIDQGFGMNEDQVKIAFLKYGKVANENSGKVDSFGFGLPIVKQLVELQGGEIEINSEPEKGTEMKLKFKYLDDTTYL